MLMDVLAEPGQRRACAVDSHLAHGGIKACRHRLNWINSTEKQRLNIP